MALRVVCVLALDRGVTEELSPLWAVEHHAKQVVPKAGLVPRDPHTHLPAVSTDLSHLGRCFMSSQLH